MKYRIKEAVVVEGRYDKNAVSQVLDTLILETEGFGLFSDREKLRLIRAAAVKRGVIVLTDSDSAGFLIRNRIRGAVPDGTVKHAYIPDIPGKERRKSAPSREGKLGVEGVGPSVILKAVRAAGATFEDEDPPGQAPGGITRTDYYELGLTGAPDSGARREELKRRLGLPQRLSGQGLFQVLSGLYTREELEKLI